MIANFGFGNGETAFSQSMSSKKDAASCPCNSVERRAVNSKVYARDPNFANCDKLYLDGRLLD